MNETEVPNVLRTWFLIHFVIDVLFALPLMVAPVWVLELFGWQAVDPYTTRIAAAALFGIGIESYLGRNAGVESFQNMLTLKVVWSLAAVVGLGWSLLQGAQGRPLFAWLVFAIFVGFNFLWVYWRRRLGASE